MEGRPILEALAKDFDCSSVASGHEILDSIPSVGSERLDRTSPNGNEVTPRF